MVSRHLAQIIECLRSCAIQSSIRTQYRSEGFAVWASQKRRIGLHLPQEIPDEPENGRRLGPPRRARRGSCCRSAGALTRAHPSANR